ncbi:hypothetical protein H6G17_19920 [Chroococcidiopsis sp. FACHB-1243]|uniref:hypothetical protein n=1 Tax=Chroococcidiopsis sp. [FACHB-1243] TaxID=2692781 RepID=UPI00177F7C27|nr:hypothetical protein [Chroococcidiopsis sp. [FACHB-1243]]MBD2307739.1 hypothetical protein [Chroococcidiopsis sp. [FACHB-1243]]
MKRKFINNKSIACALAYPCELPQLWKTQGIIALAAMALVIPSGALNATEVTSVTHQKNVIAQADTRRTPQERQNVTAEELADKVKALVGKTVTVRGQFVKQIGDNVFAIVDERFFGAEPIVVVNISGNPLNIPTDDIKVQATGVVRNFSLEQVSKYYNTSFDRATQALYKNSPVVVARSVAPAPEADELTITPQPYYGRRIAVPGDVSNIYSPYAFTLDESLLVLNPNPQPNFRQNVDRGEKVVTTGVLRQFVIADLERDYGLKFDADVRRQLETAYAGKPVLISDGVYPSAVEQ